MNNSNTNQTNFQSKSRRELIEQSRLSGFSAREPFRLPDFDNAPTKPVAVVAVCAGCDGRLDTSDPIQMKFSSCRKCIGISGRVEAAAEAAAEANEKRARRELLEKMAGGAR